MHDDVGALALKLATSNASCTPNVNTCTAARRSLSPRTAARPTHALVISIMMVAHCSPSSAGSSASGEKEIDADQNMAENSWRPESMSMPSRMSKQNRNAVGMVEWGL
eukprot:2391352-Prymnesium_polylepis.1